MAEVSGSRADRGFMQGAAPDFADILSAAEQIRGVAVHTPLLRADALDEACGGRVIVKAECLQRTGSFKFRGAYNLISRLTADERRAGVVAFSSGNHAQAVAAAARIVGCPAVIVMPADAPAVKIAATRGFGAEVVLYDRYKDSREDIAAALLAERGGVLAPPFEHPHIIAGQGTLGLEAVGQLKDAGVRADLVLCPASGGGLIAGVALAVEALSPGTTVHSVEPEGFDDHRRSLESGVRQSNAPDGRSICDSLLTPSPGELTFSINRTRLSPGVTASDDDALRAIGFAFRHLRVVIEPGGSLGLAALLAGRFELAGRTALVVASGGNVDAALFARAISAN